jgi:L-gulonate 3-dehydrogenase
MMVSREKVTPPAIEGVSRVRVACIGAGVIGRSWALAFARAGHEVQLYDADPTVGRKAMQLIDESARVLEQAGLIAASHNRLSIRVSKTLADAVVECAYVQESVAEDLLLKTRVFGQLDRASPPEATLASSTSSISASSFTAGLAGKSRCLVAHPVNPPHLIRLVELCPTPWTDPAVIQSTSSLMRSIGQEPIVLRKEMSGFVLNRLQVALIGEALHLIGEGVCAPEDVDKVVTYGLGLRWALIGPFASGHLNADEGYGAYMRKFRPAIEAMTRDLHVDYPWTDALLDRIDRALRAHVPPEAIFSQQLARDRDLLALRIHLDSSRT